VSLRFSLYLSLSPSLTLRAQVVKLNSREEASKYYFHCVKQAVFLLTGSTRLATSLSIQRQSDLMDSIVTGTWTAAVSLPLTPSVSQ
jgi:hypothetical protein